MASSLPPVKGAAFTFYTSLVDVGDTDTFQDNPTLAEGDVVCIKDGTYDDHLDTLPVAVASCTRVIKVDLSATEMTADIVTVLFHDAAGDEWQDQVVTIYTAAQTLDATDAIADGIKTKTDFLPSVAAGAAGGVFIAGSNAATSITTALTANITGNLSGSVGSVTALGAQAKLDVNAEADTALSDIRLDHLVAVADADDAVNDSIIAKLASKSATADWSTYVNTTDSLEAARDNIGTAGAGLTGLTATVAISAAAAASVASGSLAIRTYHTWSQAITSTSTAALNTATKVWLAVKTDEDDTDAISVIFMEASAGLTYLAGAAYATPLNGTIVVTGSSGAWIITLGLQEAATALLGAYENQELPAEVKALVAGDTVHVWDGTATISQGVVRAYS